MTCNTISSHELYGEHSFNKSHIGVERFSDLLVNTLSKLQKQTRNHVPVRIKMKFPSTLATYRQHLHNRFCLGDTLDCDSKNNFLASHSREALMRTLAWPELSLSLPNLSEVMENDVGYALNTTNSLSDIAHNHTDSAPGCNTLNCGPNANGTSSLEQDIHISVNPEGRLSAVLENISLMYIPKTKQLVSPDSESQPECQKSPKIEGCNGFSECELKEEVCGADSDQDVTLTESQHDKTLNGYSLCNSSESHSLNKEFSEVNLNDDQETEDEETKLCDSSKISSDNSTVERNASTTSSHRVDGTSLSSNSTLSSCTDLSASAASDLEVTDSKDNKNKEGGDGFVEINLHTRNSYERSRSSGSSQDSGIDVRQAQTPCGTGAKPKTKGLASFLSRSLFSWKPTKDQNEEPQSLGWKLFGKVPPKSAPPCKSPTTPTPSQTTPQSSSGMPTIAVNHPPPAAASSGRKTRKGTGVEVLSTTALILEQRPQGLPSKSPEEEERHRQQYEAMVEAAKKKEQKEAKLRKKQLQQQLKHEDALAAAVRTWNSEILANWDTMWSSKKASDLWWKGVPPSVRGRVWRLAIGNELNLTPELYHICLNRAKERLRLIEDWCGDTDSISSHMSGYSEHSMSREASVELIKLDVSRTFPQLCIFQKGGPYHELLQGLLGAYACYRPDVGYVQGMSFIAAVLLLNMEVEQAFICFANLLNQPCQIAFFRLDENLMRSYFDAYEEFFQENLPKLYSHFKKQSLTPDLYIIDWMFTMYAKSLPLDVASRVWDMFCRDGEEFLFRTALGILKLYEEVLMNMDFIHLAQFLTRLPEHISSESLFANIDTIQMSIDKRKFQQVFQAHRDNRDTRES